MNPIKFQLIFFFFGGVLLSLFTYEQWYIPSGYLTVRHGKIHHFYPYLSSVNHLFLWAIYTMAMSAITRWYHQYILDFPIKTSIYKGFSMAMSATTRWYQYIFYHLFFSTPQVFIWAISSHFSCRRSLNLLMNSLHYPLVNIQKTMEFIPMLGKSQKTMELITIL